MQPHVWCGAMMFMINGILSSAVLLQEPISVDKVREKCVILLSAFSFYIICLANTNIHFLFRRTGGNVKRSCNLWRLYVSHVRRIVKTKTTVSI